MARPVSAAVGPSWREVGTPYEIGGNEYAGVKWRYNALRLECAWDYPAATWFPVTEQDRARILGRFPRFEQFWLDLFLNP